MRNVQLGLRWVGLALLGALACDGGRSRAPKFDGGAGGSDAGLPPGGPPDAESGDRGGNVVDEAAPPDFGPLPMALPLPAAGPKPQRFLGPEDRLAGYGTNSCSEPDPATPGATRWCVFYRTLAAPAATTELWVINLSKAVAGAVPRCDGSSPDCVRLTTTLWTGLPLGGPGHPYDHRFGGETLVYYAASSSTGQQIHKGPVSVWRPGWTQPAVLTSAQGVMCFPHGRKPLVHCMDDLAGDPMRPDSFELRVGSVAVRPTAPLTSLGRVRPFLTNGDVGWQAAFSPDGATFALSSPDPDPAVETLRIFATKDLGAQPPREVLHGGNSWTIGNDSQRIYYLRREEGEGNDARGLYAADFPGGGAEVKLGGPIRDYLVMGEGEADQGVSFLVKLVGDRGAFAFLRDSRMPASALTLFTYRDFLEGVQVSPDARYTAWLDAGFNARVVRHSDRTSCKLNIYPGGAAFGPQFLGSAGLVFWNEDVLDTGRRDAFFARPEDCSGTERFASGVLYYTALADRGLIYTDESDVTNHGALKYVAAKPNGSTWGLATPVRIHDQVDEGEFTLVGSPPSLVLYRTSARNEPNPGTWVFGPLPL